MKNWIILIIICLSFCLEACKKPYPSEMSIAETIVKEKPDSALFLLNSIKKHISHQELSIQMHYNLLLIKAQDKCYKRHLSDSTIKVVVHFYENSHQPDKLIEAYYYLGRVYMDMREAPPAFKAFQKAIEISQNTHRTDLLGLTFSQIASLYSYQDMYEEALPMYKNALKHFLIIKDSLAIPYALRDIGRMFKATGRNDSAFLYYEKSFEYADKIGDIRRKNVIAGELATLYLQHNQYDKAVLLLRMLSTNSIPKHNFGQYYNNWGDYFYQKNLTDSASLYYRRSLMINNIYTKPHTYWRLYQIEKKSGNNSMMLQYLINYCNSSDSVQVNKKEETIRKLRAMYDFHRTEKENDELREKTIIQRYWILFFMVVILLSSIIYYQYNVRRKYKMKELEDKLNSLRKNQYEKSRKFVDDNNREIEKLKLQLEKSSQEIDSLELQLLNARKEKLESVNSQAEAEQKEKNILITTLKRTPIYIKCYEAIQNNNIKLTDEDWVKLQIVVNTAYDDFSQRLFFLYSSITRIELQICLLIKIGLPVATVSQLTYRSPSAVSMCRKQLYKKIFKKDGSPLDLDNFIHAL